MQNVYRHNVEFRHYQPRPSVSKPSGDASNQNIDPNLEAQQQAGAESSAEALNVSEASSEHTDIIPPPPGTQSARILPSVEITPENVDDSYVQFIFYCNPFIPTTKDTTELRKGFRSPPKTDGKAFDTFALFELIKKLNNKEIETWSQLVIELGVKPPDISKNQSTQKVQQFAVRLKKWLHAYHIDAFFQYCLGKSNAYFKDIPNESKPTSETVRDGIPSEEDYALRALLPEWAPKRGRRKAQHLGDSEDPSHKRHRRAMSAETIQPVQHGRAEHTPQSAYPWSQEPTSDDIWGAAHRAIAPNPAVQTPVVAKPPDPSALPSNQTFWVEPPNTAPETPYPQATLTPSIENAPYNPSAFPKSAHPYSASVRGRRKHGPAISSAWPSSAGGDYTGKMRGRPPSDRSVQDGPYSRFPIRPPSTQCSPKANAFPIVPQPKSSPPMAQPMNGVRIAAKPPSTPEQYYSSLLRKPRGLQLQVPENEGGSVRLATPPAPLGPPAIPAPRVTVNGEDDDDRRSYASIPRRGMSVEFFDDIDAGGEYDEDQGSMDRIDWKRRALMLQRKLKDKEEELRMLKKRVLEAVM